MLCLTSLGDHNTEKKPESAKKSYKRSAADILDVRAWEQLYLIKVVIQ